jgi:hypothetical protein
MRPESDLDGCEKREKPANDGGLDAWTAGNPQAGDEAVPGSHNGGNEAARFRSDIADAYEELRERGESVDDGSIPAFLRRCAQCKEPGGAECAYDGVTTWLHPDCRQSWRESYEASHRNGPTDFMCSSAA